MTLPTLRARGLDRRSFLRSAMLLPGAMALPRAPGLWLPGGNARALLVLELQGGNDGLNTVIPVEDDGYARARPTLANVRSGALPIGGGRSLHGALAALAKRVLGGGAAVVHGVGYDPPDRSHFRSRDIWHTADPQHQQVQSDTSGWLGRAAALLAQDGAGVPAAALGSLQVPLLLHNETVVVPALERAEDYALLTTAPHSAEHERALAALVRGSRPVGQQSAHAFVADTAQAAAEQAATLQQGLHRYTAAVDYPDTELGRALQLAARVLIAGFGTRLYHCGLAGFDTHAQQLPTHAGLLRQLDDALDALLRDLQAHDRLRDTAVFVHSEFGRRVRENQSLGTDHGAAGPVFVCGGGVQPGQHGTPPDLTDLRDGDLRATTDFRSVYAALLEWLGLDANTVLGPGPVALPMFAD